MKRFIYLMPILLVAFASQLASGQGSVGLPSEADNAVPQLGAMGDRNSQTATETANAWTRFIDNSKRALAHPFKPNNNAGSTLPLGGNIVQKINHGTKRLVANTKQAITPKFSPPKFTPPKITPPSLSTPIFNAKPAGLGNGLKNIFSPSPATRDQPRRSILTSWLPPARKPEPQQPPTLGDWLSQDRPQ